MLHTRHQQSTKMVTNAKVNQKETNRNESREVKKKKAVAAAAVVAATYINKSENTEQITIIYRPVEVQ